MLHLSKEWIGKLVAQPETGMGYQIASVLLHDGRKFNQVVINSGYITQIRGRDDIPFAEPDIREIIVTHDKWDFNKERRS
jgi:hypothetical protein